MSYTSDMLKMLKKKYPQENEFLSATQEVLQSIGLVADHNPAFQKRALLERLVEPDRILSFRVSWQNDNGQTEVNKGYRVQFNNALGPYKGGLRLHPTVNQSILKFLGFEQIFKNSLTGLALGGAKGGSDFDPKYKSDNEILHFCIAFMTELYKHMGADTDIPAGDIGTGTREIGYMYGTYKKLAGVHTGALTGKGLEFGGSLVRTEATGYGLVYLTQELLKDNGDSLHGKKLVVSGSGNVAIYAAQKAQELGGTVLAMSDSFGWIFDKDGVKIDVVKKIKEPNRGRLSEYKDSVPSAEYHTKGSLWEVPCDIALPCATQHELTLPHAKTLVKNGVKIVAEGANMPTFGEAVHHLQTNGVLFLPGKAANCGGVATSGFEMMQNSARTFWSFAQVDTALQSLMSTVYQRIKQTNQKHSLGNNFVAGANILGFEKVAKAMMAQGI
ncbi:MAG: NADP-specific glutamate dehydrogenase [Firmicutes bacterium]|nr:NADP-specific glutamate dehydrogenase [Bacillota bacterium]